MCRSIKRLRNETIATREEIRAASLQFVRKISGFHKPSKVNQEAFESAVEEIAGVAERMLQQVSRPAAVPKTHAQQSAVLP